MIRSGPVLPPNGAFRVGRMAVLKIRDRRCAHGCSDAVSDAVNDILVELGKIDPLPAV